MMLRSHVLKYCIRKYLKVPNKFAYVAFSGQIDKYTYKLIAHKTSGNFSICNIPCQYYIHQNNIVGSQGHVISKRFYSSKHIKSKLRKDDDLQPELKEIPLEEGNFALSKHHFEKKIQIKDIGRKFTVGEDVITALKNVYGIDRRMALTMMRSQKFLLVADSTILQTLNLLAKNKISPEQIQRIPWMLLYDYETLQSKIDLLVDPHLFETTEDGLGFCYLPKQRILNTKTFFSFEANKFPNHRNRLYCMAEMLEVPVAHLTERIVKPYRVMSMDFKRIVELLDILKNYNVSSDDIVRDLWIFYHNVERTEKRLRAINKAGCERPRLWMCRCTEEVFEKSTKNHEDRKSIMGDNLTVVEYLAEQLECSENEIELHCAINEKLLRVRVPKIQKKMELLLAAGITREAIRATPRVLQHSEEKLRNRINRLKALGYQLTHCPPLFKSESEFEKFCKSLKDRNLRMENSTQDLSANGVMDPWINPPEDNLF